jgi:hypothetical protein
MCHGDAYPELWAIWKISGEDVLIVAALGEAEETISGYRRRMK